MKDIIKKMLAALRFAGALSKKLLAVFRSVGPLSVGKINAYLTCPMKYKYQYLARRKSRIKSHYLSFAGSIRTSIEAIHSSDLAEISEEEIFEILKSNWKREGFTGSEQEDSFWMLGLKILVDYVGKNRVYKNTVVATNENVSGKFAGFNFDARFSQVARNADRKIEVVQFKTGKRLQKEESLKSDLQSVVNYCLAKEKWGRKFESYSVYNLYHGIKIKVEPTEKDIRNCEDIVRSEARKIKLGSFDAEQGPLCSWCDFASVCPARKKLPDPRIYKRVLESKRLALSYSKFSVYKNCPRNYKRIYIDKIATKPRYFFSIGLTIHKTMEDIYTYSGFATPSLKYLLSRYRKNWVGQGYESEEQETNYRDEGARWLENYYKKHLAGGGWKRAWKVEPYFEVPLQGRNIGAGHLLVGFIDRIEQNSDGSYTIYDYKTDPLMRTQEDVDGDLQLTMYYWVCEKYFDIRIRELALIFFRFNEIVRTSRSREDTDKMLDMVNRLGAEIILNFESAEGLPKEEADSYFPPKINKYCGGCDFLNDCPLKDEILKMDSSKVMNVTDDLKVNDGELGPDEVNAQLLKFEKKKK